MHLFMQIAYIFFLNLYREVWIWVGNLYREVRVGNLYREVRVYCEGTVVIMNQTLKVKSWGGHKAQK